MRLVVTVTALWLCALPSALAQTKDWLVLPTTLEDEALWMRSTVTKVNRALRRQGLGAWSPDQAAAMFRERGSVEPPLVPDTEVDTWAKRSQQALLSLARGDSATALTELEEVQAFSRRNLVTLNRDSARAQAVLDACLYLVRAVAESGDEIGATRQARECIRMAPSGTPTRGMHPPAVVELYEEAAGLGPNRTSALLVESEPSNCELRVNGVPIGQTPSRLTDLYPGSYQVQVECDPGAPGRVHRVEVPRGSTSVFVFDRFDRSVRSSSLLHLRYDELPEPPRLARDAREVARALPASVVIVASLVSPGVLQLQMAAGTQGAAALVRIATSTTGPTDSAVDESIAALLTAECADFTGDEPVAIDCRSGRPVAQTSRGATDAKSRPLRPPRGQFVSGVALASAGTASLLAGYGLLITRRSAGEDWLNDPNSLSAQDKWLKLGTGVIATGAAGGGLLVAAMPLVLPYKAKTPWWAWLSGGLGVGAAVGSIVSGVTADPKPPVSCTLNGPDPTACVIRGRDIDRAILLGATAAPLLTMPLVYLLRKSDKKRQADLEPSVVVGRQGGVFAIRGTF